MAIGIPRYKKGLMGHVLDMRKAMGAMEIHSREWCRAFDKGDDAAMVRIGALLAETIKDLSDASEAVGKAAQ